MRSILNLIDCKDQPQPLYTNCFKDADHRKWNSLKQGLVSPDISLCTCHF